MSLWKRIADHFWPAPPRLRNVAGGLAWIKRFDVESGAGALAGRIVRTVRVVEGDKWVIDPPQDWRTIAAVLYEGYLLPHGTVCTSVAISDDLLEPIPAVGDEERDESAAWLPPVPTSPLKDPAFGREFEKAMLEEYLRNPPVER